MHSEDVEGIRQRIVSLLDDANRIRRYATRALKSMGDRRARLLASLNESAERIDQATRELYHRLPESLRPSQIPQPYTPRGHVSGDSAGRTSSPRPGGPLPRKVRWPDWTISDILRLIDKYHEMHGVWPTSKSGRISESAADTWTGIDLALKKGNRGLPGGTTLARLIAEHRGVRNRSVELPKFTLDDVLRWCDDHCARTGAWPHVDSGPILAAPGETWDGINHALRLAKRFVGESTTLARLLALHRGVENKQDLAPLTEEQILNWAESHFTRTGEWPTRKSGPVLEAPGEDWRRINNALIQGNRTLKGGSSLARLLAMHRGVRNRKALPPYDVETIVTWAKLHHKRTGRWPTTWSGPVADAPGETWNGVDSAFKQGGRGLGGSSYRSLSHLLDDRVGKLVRRGNRPAERETLE